MERSVFSSEGINSTFFSLFMSSRFKFKKVSRWYLCRLQKEIVELTLFKFGQQGGIDGCSLKTKRHVQIHYFQINESRTQCTFCFQGIRNRSVR